MSSKYTNDNEIMFIAAASQRQAHALLYTAWV